MLRMDFSATPTMRMPSRILKAPGIWGLYDAQITLVEAGRQLLSSSAEMVGTIIDAEGRIMIMAMDYARIAPLFMVDTMLCTI